jgi:hypothetical protein
MNREALALMFACVTMSLSAPAVLAQDAPLEIRVENGRFEPRQLTLPAKAPVQLRVTNADPAAVEFESFELHRERVVQPGGTIRVLMPALAPGTYKFFDDFHRDTPEGSIVVE